MRLLVDAQRPPALCEWFGERGYFAARGVKGGEIVAEGTPEAVARAAELYGEVSCAVLERGRVGERAEVEAE